MYTYILSIIIVSFISLCFFKKRFWENRYLVLTIIAGVSLVATLTINFAKRGSFEKKWVIASSKNLSTFYVHDSLLKFETDELGQQVRVPSIIENFKFCDDYDWEHFKLAENQKTPFSIIVYKPKDKIYVGFFTRTQKYLELKDVYIAPSNNDSTAYISKVKHVYNVPKNRWITAFSLPRIETATIFYVPPTTYAFIPDTLIRKLPF